MSEVQLSFDFDDEIEYVKELKRIYAATNSKCIFINNAYWLISTDDSNTTLGRYVIYHVKLTEKQAFALLSLTSNPY